MYRLYALVKPIDERYAIIRVIGHKKKSVALIEDNRCDMSIEKELDVLNAERDGRKLAEIEYRKGFADGYYQAQVDILGKEEADKREALKNEFKQRVLEEYLESKVR